MRAERIRLNSNSTRAAARTICSSFSSDRLICWLRPGAVPWGQLDPQSVKWQCRRVNKAIAGSMVVGFKGVESIKTKEDFDGPDKEGHAINAATKSSRSQSLEDDYAGVIILEPPQQSWKEMVESILSQIYIRILDWWDPALDDAGNETRIGIMLEAHETHRRNLQATLPLPLWYVELVAVHPSWQGQGIGGQMMKWILDRAKQEPILLECTDEKNIAFYQKFGFEVVKEVRLVEGKNDVKMWLMLKA